MMAVALATFLALGDSYTIGEGVAPAERFPSQLARALQVAEPQIIAKTGWTTDELDKAMTEAKPKGPFDLVTLLIGVNNQYRGRSAEEYRGQFSSLLKKAIALAGGRPGRVVVISIPDWGVTPFAAGRDRHKIAQEIDRFNDINRRAAIHAGARYADVTRVGSAFGSDGLHPTGRMYAQWVEVILPIARDALKK